MDLETHGTPHFSSWEGHLRVSFVCFFNGDLVPEKDTIEDYSKSYRNIEYVMEQCKYLAEQIIEDHEPFGM